jgi:hypothetical protein
MSVRCEGCGQGWKTGEPTGRCRCTSDGADLAELFGAAWLAIQVLRQRLWLAWSRRRARARIRKAQTDPYRSLGPEPRFQILVGDDSLEADTFGEVIAKMRGLGCSDDEVIEAAIVTHHQPRGGRVKRRSDVRALAAAVTSIDRTRTGMKIGKRFD